MGDRLNEIGAGWETRPRMVKKTETAAGQSQVNIDELEVGATESIPNAIDYRGIGQLSTASLRNINKSLEKNTENSRIRADCRLADRNRGVRDHEPKVRQENLFLQAADVSNDIVHGFAGDRLDRLHLPFAFGDHGRQVSIAHGLDFRRLEIFYLDFHHLGDRRNGCAIGSVT
jgi:hypothetical protein